MECTERGLHYCRLRVVAVQPVIQRHPSRRRRTNIIQVRLLQLVLSLPLSSSVASCHQLVIHGVTPFHPSPRRKLGLLKDGGHCNERLHV
jgi:hypothetical protein